MPWVYERDPDDPGTTDWNPVTRKREPVQRDGYTQYPTHALEVYYKCDTCRYATRWDGMIKNHVASHRRYLDEWYRCGECSEGFKTTQLVVDHMRLHHEALITA